MPYPPDPQVDPLGFWLWVCCSIPMALMCLMAVGIFIVLALGMLFGKKPKY